MKTLHVVFDGPPGPTAGRFVECETPDGDSINAGEWHERPNGYWELRIPNTRPLPQPSELVEDRATYATAIRDTVAGFEPAAMARFGGAFLDCAKEIEQLEAQIAKLQADGDKLARALGDIQALYGRTPSAAGSDMAEALRIATQALTEWKDRA